MGYTTNSLYNSNPGTFNDGSVSNYTPTADAEAEYKAKMQAERDAAAKAAAEKKAPSGPAGRRKKSPTSTFTPSRGQNTTTTAPTKSGLNTMSAGDRADRRQASIKAQQEKYIASTKEPGAKWSWSDFAKKASRWQKMSAIAEKGRERG